MYLILNPLRDSFGISKEGIMQVRAAKDDESLALALRDVPDAIAFDLLGLPQVTSVDVKFNVKFNKEIKND